MATAGNTTIKRKLATILAADVAGYSRLMSEDEEATLRTLGECRGVIDRLIDDHDVNLLVFNTKDDKQLAMHGMAYSLAVELRHRPLLLL